MYEGKACKILEEPDWKAKNPIQNKKKKELLLVNNTTEAHLGPIKK